MNNRGGGSFVSKSFLITELHTFNSIIPVISGLHKVPRFLRMARICMFSAWLGGAVVSVCTSSDTLNIYTASVCACVPACVYTRSLCSRAALPGHLTHGQHMSGQDRECPCRRPIRSEQSNHWLQVSANNACRCRDANQ